MKGDHGHINIHGIRGQLPGFCQVCNCLLRISLIKALLSITGIGRGKAALYGRILFVFQILQDLDGFLIFLHHRIGIA